jgi:CheY-like chemotaxis protein
VNVLCVEDDPDQRSLYRELLTALGHTMMWAETVRGAEHLLRTEEIHLVLLDVGLKGEEYGGIRVARLVPRKIPVFILSGHELADIQTHAQSEYGLSGVSLFFSKGSPGMGEALSKEIALIDSIRKKSPSLMPRGEDDEDGPPTR